MTLIALFSPRRPVLLADVLLSHEILPQLRALPTGVSLAPMPVGQMRPVDTTQKIALLNHGRIALAGTGSIGTIRMITHRLKSDYPKLRPHDLPRWLGERRTLCGSSTNIIAAWFDRSSGDFCAAGVGEDLKDFEAKEFGKVFASGSGRPWLEKYFVRSGKTVHSTNDFSFQETVVMLAVGQTGLHLSGERLVGVRDHFGGGFQVAAFNGERFEFVRDIVYLTFYAWRAPNGSAQIMLAPMINFQRCRGGALAFDVWSLSDRKSEPKAGTVVYRARGSLERNVVAPLISGVADRTPPTGEFQTPEYVNITVIHLSDADDFPRHAYFQMFGDPAMNPIRMSLGDDNAVEISVAEDALEVWMRSG